MADESYPDFPEMVKPPVIGIEQGYLDNTLASTVENGLIMTRARSGGALKRSWTVQYRNNPEADRANMDSFVRQTVRGGAGIFYWRDPRTQDVVLVRFAANRLPVITDAGYAALNDENHTAGLTYNWTLELQEV